MSGGGEPRGELMKETQQRTCHDYSLMWSSTEIRGDTDFLQQSWSSSPHRLSIRVSRLMICNIDINILWYSKRLGYPASTHSVIATDYNCMD